MGRSAFSNAVPYNEHYKYDSHRSKVLSLYKKCIKELDAWTCESGNPMEMFVWERVMLRARFEKHKNSRAASMMNYWAPEDRARYPDLYQKYEKLQQLRQESWDEEMARLDEHEEELADQGETITDALPAAKKS